ncbi:MAG: TonB-dependent receptor plug domain-containing protein [Pseudooceanicola nanhaiensis]|jgi:vitamin B12 transporter|uniref:TonB-dependent receptor plug domain-containing protein n=1 Tax=Pseudooceanicola nanhaiensis TaxID=375761 RepID=UPI004059E723
MNRHLLAAGTALATIATAAAAQEPISLAPIVVSAGLTPLQAERYGRSVTVIDGAQIRERGILSVQDALRGVPGVSVSGTGASFTKVRIRGGESNHTLILIDGVQAAGGDGEYILTGLETANVERIEVLRGPQSVYYGSNASAGVINIITRKGGEGTRAGGGFEYGGGWAANAFASYRDARGGVALSLARRDDEGWDYSGSDGEKDGIERRTLQLSGDYEVAEGLTLGFTYRLSDETYDYDSNSFSATTADDYVIDDPTQFSDRDERLAQVYGEYVTPDGRASGRLSWERTDFDQSYNGGTPTDTESEAVKLRVSYGLSGPIAAGGNVVSVLVEREEDSSSANPAYNRENRSVALEYRTTLADAVDLQLGVRHDDNSVFGDSTTWNVGASWLLTNGMRLHASAGTGVVNPSYFELYANAFGYVGNPDLDPERNRSYDIGLEMPFASGRGLVDVTYFNETLTDEITAVSLAGGGNTYINQTGESDRQGVEVQGSFDATDALSFRLSYTYLDAENPDGSVEPNRPMHELGLGTTWRSADGRGTISADARYVAGNYDPQFFGSYATAELPDYWKVDVAATYAVTDALMLNARVENLFDEEYSESWGYATRGRTAYIGVSSQW